MLLDDAAEHQDVTQSSVTAIDNDGDVDSVVNNNDCISPSTNGKLSSDLGG